MYLVYLQADLQWLPYCCSILINIEHFVSNVTKHAMCKHVRGSLPRNNERNGKNYDFCFCRRPPTLSINNWVTYGVNTEQVWSMTLQNWNSSLWSWQKVSEHHTNIISSFPLLKSENRSKILQCRKFHRLLSKSLVWNSTLHFLTVTVWRHIWNIVFHCIALEIQ